MLDNGVYLGNRWVKVHPRDYGVAEWLPHGVDGHLGFQSASLIPDRLSALRLTTCDEIRARRKQRMAWKHATDSRHSNLILAGPHQRRRTTCHARKWQTLSSSQQEGSIISPDRYSRE